MGSILPFIRKAGGVFDDTVTEIMGHAFDSACKELHDSGQPEIVYEVIARRIIEAARKGERDPIRLRNAGLAALGFGSDKQAGQAIRQMQDLSAKLEKLLTEAEDCDLIGRLATDVKKREVFRKLATDLRRMARDIEAVMAARP